MQRWALALGLACALGVPVGVGAFTFFYAKGFSYLSTDPRACVNCHVMNEQYAAWMKSEHATERPARGAIYRRRRARRCSAAFNGGEPGGRPA